MQVETLIERLAESRASQRDKLTAMHDQISTIRAFADPDFASMVRAIRKHINSPRLATELAGLIDALTRERVPIPVATLPPPPPPPVPIVAVAAGADLAASFEAEIAENPDAHDLYLAYGDWLSSHDDPRGELIAIGRELAKNPGHKEMLAAHRELAPKVLGPLAECEDLVTGTEWHLGFIKKCRLSYTSARFNGERPRVDLARVLGWILDDPGPGRFLQHLTVGIVVHDNNTYEQLCAVLARRKRSSLRTLYLGDFEQEECELNWARVGDISSLWAAVPKLRELTLRAGSMTLGPIHLPELEMFRTITGGLDATSLGHIAAADWPRLETLSLQIGLGREGAATSADLVEPILAGDRLPRLRSLALANCEFTDELCARLPDAAILPQLETLDLSMGTMSDAGFDALVSRADRFTHLKRLDLDDNFLTRVSRDRLAATPIKLNYGSQRDDEGDPDNRFASAYE